MEDQAVHWREVLHSLADRLAREISSCDELERLREVELQAFGRKGVVTAQKKRIGTLPHDQRRDFGKAVGELTASLRSALADQKAALRERMLASELADETFDETLPGSRPSGAALAHDGTLHPLTIVQRELEEVFTSMGFHVLDFPEIDTEFHNFEGLNIPSWHPARDMQDTFWLQSGHLLRTHTSTGQVRAMHLAGIEPPFRAVFPGKVYRYEATDASHEHTFHQCEGLMVDRHVSVGHLLDSMRTLLSAIFGKSVKVRLRPGYFPFVEPGFELDIACQVCSGQGCPVCKQSGWVELLPCGLVHPNVLRAGNLDPDKWQGWAFGLGLTRLVMMRYAIPDIRLILGGDVRFLEQFTAAR